MGNSLRNIGYRVGIMTIEASTSRSGASPGFEHFETVQN